MSNLTMDGLRQLAPRAPRAAAYSGIERGTTTFDLTVSQLRTNQIYVIGEVRQPGAYQLASVATVMNALYAADGPTDLGSLRQVRAPPPRRRDGHARPLPLPARRRRRHRTRSSSRATSSSSRLREQAGLARGLGRVGEARLPQPAPGRRPASTSLRAAGGFGPDARRNRITIHRVLEPGDRGPGLADRAAVDLELAASDDPSDPRYLGGVIVPPVGSSTATRSSWTSVAALEDAYYVTVRAGCSRPDASPGGTA
ncbi:MAG: SLBB domain-containing protein [Gemmatimonadota bacterium]|nr:SLBB domain-containing protein [Gemmatimonadota bacterium]